VVRGREGQAAEVGVDVAKREVVGVCRWRDGSFLRPWSVDNPGELADFVGLLQRVKTGRELTVAMEPTGTYGDALRQALSDAGMALVRVSPKAAHDYAEVFDGVPSQHDGKDAALAADGEAFARLRAWGGPYLAADKVRGLLASAATTMGVRQGTVEVRMVRAIAEQALTAHGEVTRSVRQLRKLAEGHEVIQCQGVAIGVPTACVLWVHLGDPREYHCAEAYRKAMGLNLAERSSGEYEGRLRISKRGSAEVRRWLYFAALRLVMSRAVRPWYLHKKAADGEEAKRALVGVMRRLAIGLYRVAVDGVVFDAARLFPGGRMVAAGV